MCKPAKDSIVWDLGALYECPDDPLLSEDIEAALKGAAFLRQYCPGDLLRGKILAEALMSYESICEKGLKPLLYSQLKYYEDVRDERTRTFYQRIEEKWETIQEDLTDFELKLISIPTGHLKGLAKDPHLSQYANYLFACLKRANHSLSLGEENIMRKKQVSGRNALVSIYHYHIAQIKVHLNLGGEEQVLGIGQITSLLAKAPGNAGRQAYNSMLKAVAQHGSVWGQLMNALTYDRLIDSEVRGFSSPFEKQNVEDQVDSTAIIQILDLVEEHYGMARDYLRWKAQVLGLDSLSYPDIHCQFNEGLCIDPTQACEIVVRAFREFHPAFGNIAKEMYEQKRVHLKPNPGKKPGAFCGCLAPSQPSFVIMTYNGSIADVLTLAHEMGHAVHYKLASGQSHLNFMPVPIVSETVSTLFELVVAEYLRTRGHRVADKRDILTAWIEDMLKTVFRQAVITLFEQRVHKARRDRVMQVSEICELWLQENKRLYGDMVELSQDFGWGWVHIPHIFERPFYCYSYLFGALASISIYLGHNTQGATERFIAFLEAGSSRPPQELFWDMGLDIYDWSMWKDALRYIQTQIRTAINIGEQ